MTHFADRIIEACLQKESRLVVGLDPHWDLIPAEFKSRYSEDAVEQVLGDFMIRVVDACVGDAVAFKPQIAFFEQFGIPGFKALTRTLSHIQNNDGIVIMDAKRNDIGSTAAAYARAYFGDEARAPAFAADGLTINAYLGSDGVRPFLTNDANGVFVLVKTSNASSGEFQDLTLSSGESVAETVAHTVCGWNRETIGKSGYGNVGAVIGATYPEHMRGLRKAMPESLILVPGYGAQGGSDKAIRSAFNSDGLGALINSSRGIIFPKRLTSEGFLAVSAAAKQAKHHIRHILNS